MLSKNSLFSVRTVLISRGEPTQICYCIIAWEILEKKKDIFPLQVKIILHQKYQLELKMNHVL